MFVYVFFVVVVVGIFLVFLFFLCFDVEFIVMLLSSDKQSRVVKYGLLFRELTNLGVNINPYMIGFRNYEVKELSQTYSDVGDGIKLAMFNTMGNLEIAINRGVEGYGGSASQLLGLKEDEIITVTFNK